MEILSVLEFLGASATIAGSFLISRGKGDKFLYLGFISFLTANSLMFAFAGGIGMISLQIQMVAFFILGIPVITSTKMFERNRGKTYLYLIVAFSVSMILFSVVRTEELNYSYTYIEIITAIMAVIGSYIMKYDNRDIKTIGFMLFFIADLIYIFISVEKGLVFFGIQSVFFLYTSVSGIKNELKGDSFIYWIKNPFFIQSKSF